MCDESVIKRTDELMEHVSGAGSPWILDEDSLWWYFWQVYNMCHQFSAKVLLGLLTSTFIMCGS